MREILEKLDMLFNESRQLKAANATLKLKAIKESLSSAKEAYIDTGIIPHETFNDMLDKDSTPTKKFIHWMCKVFVNNKMTQDKIDLFDSLKDFERLSAKNLIKNKDINSYKSIEQVSSEIDKYSGTKTGTETRKELKAEGAQVIFKNDKVAVIKPLNREAAIFYGKGTKWCTSAMKSNKFKHYFGDRDIRLYYVIRKSDGKKFAVSTGYRDKDGNLYDQIFNENDQVISLEQFSSEMSGTGIPMNIFLRASESELEQKRVTVMKKETKKFLKSFLKREDVVKNSEGSYDVDGDLYMSGLSLKSFDELGIVISNVKGKFNCSYNKLTSLDGIPKYIGGSFDCDGNELTSLVGAPRKVNGTLSCESNKLTSLEGCPEEVGGNFELNDNQLTSLKGCPKKIGDGFTIYRNPLESLEGMTQDIGGLIYISDCGLTSMVGLPEIVNDTLVFSENEITSLEGCPKEVRGNFRCEGNKKKFTEEEIRAVCNVGGKVEIE